MPSRSPWVPPGCRSRSGYDTRGGCRGSWDMLFWTCPNETHPEGLRGEIRRTATGPELWARCFGDRRRSPMCGRKSESTITTPEPRPSSRHPSGGLRHSRIPRGAWRSTSKPCTRPSASRPPTKTTISGATTVDGGATSRSITGTTPSNGSVVPPAPSVSRRLARSGTSSSPSWVDPGREAVPGVPIETARTEPTCRTADTS